MSNSLPLVVANLKANFTWDEVEVWLSKVGPKSQDFSGTIVVCPSWPHIVASFQKIKSAGWQIKVGSQDISRFEQGAYTGEVAASQIVGACDYAIIGHSERRQNFSESDQILQEKVKNTKLVQIEPIFCVQDEGTIIPQGVAVVAYEPTFAIGTGNPDTPENAHKVANEIKSRGDYVVIYGGSVDSGNVAGFLKNDVIDGVLIGATNSLDMQKFTSILTSAKY